MKIMIQKVLQTENLPVEGSMDLSELEMLNNDIRKIDKVTIKGHVSLVDDYFYCHLNISGTMTLPCARTAIDVHYPFDVDVVEIFSNNPIDEEEEELEIHPVEGNVLDLEPLIKENVLLEVPFRIYADKEAIEKHAISSGEGWKVHSEDEAAKEKEQKIDPRFAKLQTLLEDKKNENQDG